MRRSLRIGAWVLAAVSVIVAALNFFYFWRLAPGAAAVLPASFALSGTLIGAALTIELQISSSDREHGSKIELNKVKHQQQIYFHELEREQQMRMAALERRLQTHQEAYQILQGYHDERFVSTLMSYCSSAEREVVDNSEFSQSLYRKLVQRWYSDHCLYLEQEADVQFRAAVHDDHDYKTAQDEIRRAVYLPEVNLD